MVGMAEKQNGLSRRIKESFIISDDAIYTWENQYTTFGYKREEEHGIVQSGLLEKDDAIIIKVSEKTRADAVDFPDYIDYGQSVIYWLGQIGRGKNIERKMIDGKHDIFLFLKIRKNCYKYLGRLEVISYDFEPKGISSKIIFSMTEYAEKRELQSLQVGNSGLRLDIQNYSQTTKMTETEVRIAQAKYRKDSLEFWNCQCAITGVREKGLLIAGHIKPWRLATDSERIDPANSLILTPLYDKLFDRGYITFNPTNGIIEITDKGSPNFYRDIDILGVTGKEKLAFLTEQTGNYLLFHRYRVFNFAQKSDSGSEEEMRMVH